MHPLLISLICNTEHASRILLDVCQFLVVQVDYSLFNEKTHFLSFGQTFGGAYSPVYTFWPQDPAKIGGKRQKTTTTNPPPWPPPPRNRRVEKLNMMPCSDICAVHMQNMLLYQGHLLLLGHYLLLLQKLRSGAASAATNY